MNFSSLPMAGEQCWLNQPMAVNTFMPQKEEPLRKRNVIHWFRTKGLRLHDNPALVEALKGADTWRCVYILDPWFAGNSQAGINKWR